MHEALVRMIAKYECRRLEDTMWALREIMQAIALLGLWRSKFFENAAFYGKNSKFQELRKSIEEKNKAEKAKVKK